jgi:AraC-like DNA-binding protein
MPAAPPGYHRFVHAHFSPAPAIAPAVRMAVRYQRLGSTLSPVQRLALADWVIDHGDQAGLRIRLGDQGAWADRPARQCRCYAPGTVFWEDWSAVAGRRFGGTYLMVRDAPDGALARLLAGRPARLVDDPGGTIAALLDRAVADGPPAFWEAQAALAGLLGLLAAARPLGDDRFLLDDRLPPPSLAQAVEAELRRDLAARHSLASLAARLGLSRSALSHRFAAETGSTPLARLAQLRIELVQALLVAGRALAEAAAAAGFCDRFHCSRVFRRVAGLPPREFLRRPRRGAAASAQDRAPAASGFAPPP